MNDCKISNIEITENIDKAIDKAIDQGIERAFIELKFKKLKKVKMTVGTIAACLGLVFISSAINPALAAKVPIIGSVFKMIEKNIYLPGEYAQYATSVNEEVSDNGIDITLSDILCDGQGLYITYKVESEEPFKYTSWGDKPLDRNQLLTGEKYKKVSFSNKELDDSGVAGLEGEFLDEHTFVGMERYYLNSLETDIPEAFNFEVEFNSIRTKALKEGDKDQKFKGNWAFKVPVKVDKTISKDIAVNYKTANGLSVDSIMITPVSIVINSTNPEHAHYGVRVFDDKNIELKCESGRLYDDNKQRTYFNGVSKDCKSLRIIVYRDKLQVTGTTENSQGEVETVYEDMGEEVFIDKVINLD